MKIYVHNKDLGFWTQEPIPVTRYATQYDEDDFDRELVWCNHAGAEEEEVENEINRIDQPDITWTDRVLVCRKCGAYKFEKETDWWDAPIEGAHHE